MKKRGHARLFDLAGRIIVVTGATGLLGPEFAKTLSAAGAHVVLVGRWEVSKNKGLEEWLVKEYGTTPSAFNLDVSKKSQVQELRKKVMKKYGRIDGLVNNAQFVPRKHPKRAAPFESYPLELWNQTLATNLTGVFLCCQEMGDVMREQKKGVIVNVSSIYGMVGADQRIYGKSLLNSPPSYAATKAAVINMSRYLASYWQGKNVRVNALTLGGVYNDQHPHFVSRYVENTMLGRMAKKDEYNGAMLFLLSDASSYMTGANLVVDGGWTAW